MVAFYLPGGMPVYVFSLLLGLGATLGLAWMAWQAPARQVWERIQAGIWVFAGGLLGGRIAFVALNWSYFQEHMGESLQIYQGGLSWPGALIGALLALGIFADLNRLPLGELADACLPLGACLTLSVWLGCWVDGCAYGPLQSAWWAVPARDENGVLALRLPTQLLGALLTLGLLWLLERGWANDSRPEWLRRPGQTALLGLLLYSFILLVLSFLRADQAQLWLHLGADAWAALVFGGLALAAISFSAWRESRY